MTKHIKSRAILILLAIFIVIVIATTLADANFFTTKKGKVLSDNPNHNVQQDKNPGETTDIPQTVPDSNTQDQTGTVPETLTVTPETNTDASNEQDYTLPYAGLEEKVKALYITPHTIARKLDHYIELANKTEINAYVLDIKEEEGVVCYETELEKLRALGAYTKIYDARSTIEAFHDANIRVIGRIVCFKDNFMPRKNKALALLKEDGSLFETTESSGVKISWLNPAKQETWEYLGDLAEEALRMGFDEIQCDYVRFPEKRTVGAYVYNEPNPRNEQIEGFLSYLRNRFPKAEISADIFGIPLIAKTDTGFIGQQLETMGKDIDFLCPMIYPSHYANGTKSVMGNGVGQTINGVTYDKPDLKPYEIVYNTLIVCKKRLEEGAASLAPEAAESTASRANVKIRPYLQGFTANYLPKGYWQTYGAAQYRQQIQAVYDAGYEEWIFWNANNTYVEEAFNAQEQAQSVFSGLIHKVRQWFKK